MSENEDAVEVLLSRCEEKLTEWEIGFLESIEDHADIIIICWNDGTGLNPVNLCLPHQFSVSKVDEIFKKHPGLKQRALGRLKEQRRNDVTCRF